MHSHWGNFPPRLQILEIEFLSVFRCALHAEQSELSIGLQRGTKFESASGAPESFLALHFCYLKTNDKHTFRDHSNLALSLLMCISWAIFMKYISLQNYMAFSWLTLIVHC